MTAHERILDAAEALFTSQGYAATTTRTLALAADVNEVTLFRRFGSKAGILREVGERIGRESARFAVGDRLDELPLDEALAALARAELGAARRHGMLVLRLVFEAGTQPEVATALAAGAADNRGAVVGFLSARRARGELRTDLPVELLAEAFFALTSSLVLSRALASGGAADLPLPDDGLVEHLVSLYRSGADPGGPQADPRARVRAAHPYE